MSGYRDFDSLRETRFELEREDAGLEQDRVDQAKDLSAPYSFDAQSLLLKGGEPKPLSRVTTAPQSSVVVVGESSERAA